METFYLSSINQNETVVVKPILNPFDLTKPLTLDFNKGSALYEKTLKVL